MCALPFLLAAVACARAVTHPSPAPPGAIDTARAFQVFEPGAVDSRPEILHCPTPAYPDSLRKAGVQGRVTLEMIIDTLGRPEPGAVRALTSPHDLMSTAAVSAMLACQFAPARIRGRAVRVLVTIPLDFTIHDP